MDTTSSPAPSFIGRLGTTKPTSKRISATARKPVMLPELMYDTLAELAARLDMSTNDYAVEIILTHLRFVRVGSVRSGLG